MTGKIFIDTNILIYMQDRMDKKKFTVSRKLFEKIARENQVVFSTQILQEFYVAMTKKLGHDPVEIKHLISLFQDFEIVTIHVPVLLEAIDISILNRISFWDSLVIAAASSAHCSVIYSEDFNAGQVINGIKIINPFVDEVMRN